MRINKKNLQAALDSDNGELLNKLIRSQSENFLDKIFCVTTTTGHFYQTLKNQYPKFAIPVLIKLANHPNVLMNNSIYNPRASNIIGHFEVIIRCYLDNYLGFFGDNATIGTLLEAILHAPLTDNQTFIDLFKDGFEYIHTVHKTFISKTTLNEAMSSSIYCDKLYAQIVTTPEIFKALIQTKQDLDSFCKAFEKDRYYNGLHDKVFQKNYAQLARDQWWNAKNSSLHYGHLHKYSNKQNSETRHETNHIRRNSF